MDAMSSAAVPSQRSPTSDHPEVARLQGLLAASEQERVAQQQAHEQSVADLKRRIETLLETIAVLQRKRFGPSSEQLGAAQGKLFDEAELEALLADLGEQLEAHMPPKDAPAPDTTDPQSTDQEPPKQRPARRPLPQHLPRIERIIDLPESEKAAMAGQWRLIGYEESEQLAIVPRQPYVIRYKRAKYVPLDEDVPGGEQGVVVAPRGAQMLPKSLAHGSLLAEVVAGKFVDGLALYTLEKTFARDGIELSRQSMAGWMIQLHARLEPLAAAMKALLFEGVVIHIDETRVQVLDEPGRRAEQQSFMWVYCGGAPGRTVVWFQYAETRGGQVPRTFLAPDGPPPPGADPPTRNCYAVTDGFCVYTTLASDCRLRGHAACWAHVRRKFVEAAQGRHNTAAAHQMVALIARLYAIERELRERTARGHARTASRHAPRTQRADPRQDQGLAR
jgi:transposase